MKSYPVTQYVEAGCNFVSQSVLIFMGIHRITGGQVCDGCAEFQGGRCPAYRVLTVPGSSKPGTSPSGETVREEATRRGISINEVRRQRRTGHEESTSK